MTTAFQPSAFQNNAFQIDASTPPTAHGPISFGGRHSRKREKAINGYISVYKIIANRELVAQDRDILFSTLDPFIDAVTPIEQERRDNASYALDALPQAERIDFEAIYSNKLARQKLETELQRIANAIEQISLQNEMEEFILLLAAI